MRNLTLGAVLRASLEDNELFPVVTPETTSEIEETLIELDESYDEAKDAVEVVEELEDREEQVEALVESVEGFIAEGGMSADGAQMYYLQLERLGRGLEMLHGDNLSVSKEAYGAQDRMTASLEAAEKGKNFAQRLWDSIKAMALAAYDAIANFLGRLINSNKKLEAQAKALGEKARDLRGKTLPADAKISGGAWARNLTDRSGSLTPAGVKAVLGNFQNAMAKIKTAASSEAQGSVTREVIELTRALKGTADSLPGGYSLETSEDKFSLTRKTAEIGDIAPMTAPQIVEIDRAVTSLLKVSNDFSKSVKDSASRLTKELDKMAKTASAGAKAAEKEAEGSGAGKTAAATAAKNARARVALVRKVALEYPRIAVDIARSALVYANKSIAAYGAPTAKKDGLPS